MNHFEYEDSHEGDWDDCGDVTWNEFDWREFLSRHEKEVTRFISLYESAKSNPSRLDAIALEMDWDEEDWPGPDGEDEQELSELAFFLFEQERFFDSSDPYTIHRHPVFVVTKGLFSYLRSSWRDYCARVSFAATTSLVWEYADSIREAEQNAVLAIQSVDLGDLSLGVCHFKSTLEAINKALRAVSSLPERDGEATEIFQADCRMRLFDLRDLYLRMMRDCREECRGRDRDE